MGIRQLLCRSREFKKTLETSRPRLYRIAYAWTHNAALADDLVQETLAKAWQKHDQLRDPRAEEAWLFSIMTNCFRDHHRREHEAEDIDEMDIPCDHCLETEHLRSELVGRVRAAIAKLPPGQRQVVTLVDLEGFSYNEVSSILGIPGGTVMSRLCRARAALKTLLLPDMAAHGQAPRMRRIK
ncbi:sigma-70 family RNA polymerase sigma factor [Acidiferrobacter sp.]|uniref:RNA polymerase sigma factor n=1 Tax=Acidiferrobacter sp. TaxID=1872107 RepID=UPI00262E1F76|nr:sigma-70 family RNA polymerase sigma factor [Acidiferrobacter sp.]